MSDSPTPELENQLRELTEWRGPKTSLWKDALGAARRSTPPRAVRRTPWLPVLGIVSAAAVVFLAISIVLPSLQGAREPAAGRATRGFVKKVPPVRHVGESERYEAPSDAGRPDAQVGGDEVLGDLASRGRVSVGAPAAGLVMGAPLQFTGRPSSESERYKYEQSVAGGNSSGGATPAPSEGERFVVRKATIELGSDDVRATFTKAAHLISEAHGEFVQDSSVTGDGNQLYASLTLRVAAGRLSEVLNALRELGKVRSENAGGEDVTTQVVDLDARLRNERRVEAELLELLEKRADAPLKEVLELRRSLSEVRGSIEQMTGQRERLGRLVSLATVVVIIRPADALPTTQPGLGTYLDSALRHALRDSGRFLADSLALLLSVVVGGSIWWILLAVAILVVRATLRASRNAQRIAAHHVA